MSPEQWQKQGKPFGKPRVKSKKCIMGIDPAFRKDGFAVCIIDETKEVSFKVFKSFLDFLIWLWSPGEAPDNVIVCVENSNLQDKTFDMSGTKAVVARKSRNVGCNQAVSQCTVDACRHRYGTKRVIEISPAQKGKKWNNVYFMSMARSNGHIITQYKGNKTEQDKRDAYQIALAGERRFSLQQAGFKTNTRVTTRR